ncbi:Fic family protein [Anaerospora sp.]|uniref:Fic family protein n=1 Tax=Anaerospora sp. TaxID=1960278 RepID=UPI002897329D|nr:Fic family protein [Anaerospora sp.]
MEEIIIEYLVDYHEILKQIDEKKDILDSKSPFPRYTLKSLREKLLVEWTYHSNAIEGNNLTLVETKVVLEGIAVSGKTIHEHLEVINHREAIGYIEKIIEKQETLSEWQIENIRAIIFKGKFPKNNSSYRTLAIDVASILSVSSPVQVANLLKWYKGEAQRLHAIERAAVLHKRFVEVYPLEEGNGRIARLLLNFELMKHGYVPIVIKKEQQEEYYDKLNYLRILKDDSAFILFIARIVNQALDLYIRYIK